MSLDLEQLSRDLTDQGKLIEAGWIGFRFSVFTGEAPPPAQLEEMRNVFFAGAQHLFSSIITILDPGDIEPTEADLQRMDLIATEIKAFIEVFAAAHLPVKGTA
jgi:hypothetical protein